MKTRGEKKQDTPAIELINVCKKYSIARRNSSFMERVFFNRKRDDFWSLKNITLSVAKGEKIGLLGPNGAGKTTLIKILSGIAKPTSGDVQITGKVISLLNLDAGFHPDLTGVENIHLNGLLAGMTKSEIAKEFTSIIEFAGIGSFINAPFYTYSEGMKFRLAFSIAVAAKCDILLMDEVFVVGDIKFQQKAFQTLRALQEKNHVTTVVTSHLAVLLLAFADTFYQLDKGVIQPVPKSEMVKIFREQDRRWRSKTHIRKH